MESIENFFSELSDEQLIGAYSKLLLSLKSRRIIRTNNLIGDLGEFTALNFYNVTDTLPNLVLADPNEKAYDAYQEDNGHILYAIKATSTNTTGVFWGLENYASEIEDKQLFDFVIVVKFDKDYHLESIYQLTWQGFLQVKKWNARIKSWKLILSKDFFAVAEKLL